MHYVKCLSSAWTFSCTSVPGALTWRNIKVSVNLRFGWTLCWTYIPFTRYNRLTNQLHNRLDNYLHLVNKHPTGLTTGWMFVYTIQPVVQPVVKPVWQPVVIPVWQSWFDNMLYRVNWVQSPFNTIQPVVKPAGCQTGCTIGLTTGWMFVYTMQPVVQPAAQLNSRLNNRFDNGLDVCVHDTTCCPTRCQTGF